MPKKPHVKTLREAISKKLGIKIARIYEKAAVLAIMAQAKTEDGICLLTAQSGVNLNKYRPQEKVNQTRQLLFQLNEQTKPSQLIKSSVKKSMHKIVAVNIGKAFKLKDPLITGKVISEAKEMAEEVYPLLYVFENSVREMIIRVIRFHRKFKRKLKKGNQKRTKIPGMAKGALIPFITLTWNTLGVLCKITGQTLKKFCQPSNG